MKSFRLLSLFLALLACSQLLLAQKIGATPKDSVTATKKVAILPLMFRERDKGEEESTNTTAINDYTKALNGAFEKLGIEIVEPSRVSAGWREMTGQPFDTRHFTLPDAADLVAFGKRLGVDYVLVSRCLWHIRTPWVGLGPKTKANATVDLWLVDVHQSEFALKAEEVKADSTEKEPLWKTGVTIFIAPISVVSGGPKTPHMQRAGVLGLAKAIQPWAEKQQGDIKIKK